MAPRSLSLDLRPVDPDDGGQVAACTALANAAGRVDAPWTHPWTERSMAAILRYGWDLEPARWFLARDDGAPVGRAGLHVSEWDNRDLAWFDVEVHPDRRGQGIGSRLLAHLTDAARALGRTKHGTQAWEGSPGVAFAEHHGFTPASWAVLRRQHLAEIPTRLFADVHAEAAAMARDYALVRIRGRTPESMLEALAAASASINDAPLDDLDMEDEVYAPQRIRDYETAMTSSGHRMYRVVARHRETGELAGHTVVVVEEERPTIAHQHDTTVVRAHRGHRLGLLLKSAMNLWLADLEPQARTVDTWNAESNGHMIRVNERLGYRWTAREVQLQRHDVT